MKKNHIILSILLAGSMLSVASCTNEDTSLQTDNAGKVPLEIDVNVSKTRSIVEGTILPGESSFGIFAPKGSNYETLVNGVNNKVYFDGTSCTSDKRIYLPEGVNIPVYAYYPYNNSYNSISYMNGEMSIEVESQTDYLYGYSSDTEGRLISQNVTNPKATILFKHAMARVTINVKKAENNTNDYSLQKVSLSGIYTSANLLLKGDDDGRHVINANGNSSVGVKPMRGDVSSEENNQADILVIPMDMSDRTVTLQLEFVGHEPMTVTIPSTTWKSGQQYTYNVTIEDSRLVINQTIIQSWDNMTVKNDNINIGDGNYTGDETEVTIGGSVGVPIDLGLSVKWASHNIGASTPEEYGGLYGWADPTGMKTSNSDDEYPAKYVSGYIDICGQNLDIARRQWGVNWRLPSYEEVSDLVYKCIWTWTTLNGVNGYKVTGSNGKSIFLPAAGVRIGEEIFSKNESGNYWSGNLWRDYGGTSNFYGYNISIGSAGYGVNQHGFRSYGYSVRPVTTY